MRSRASKHRFEAWIHGPDPPSASPRSLGQACSLSVPPLPPPCNGGNRDNNGCGEDYINRSASELCKNSLTSSSYVGSHHPSPPLLPHPKVLLPRVQPVPPGLPGTLTVSVGHQGLGPHPSPRPISQAHPLCCHQRAHSEHGLVCPRTPRAPEQIQTPSWAGEPLLHSMLRSPKPMSTH